MYASGPRRLDRLGQKVDFLSLGSRAARDVNFLAVIIKRATPATRIFGVAR
jgi:hypothetical protein